MGLRRRRSRSFGPFRLTLSKSGLSGRVGAPRTAARTSQTSSLKVTQRG